MSIELFKPFRSAVGPADEEAELVRGLGRGEREAVSAVYDRYAAGLYRLLMAMLYSRADAEDALQNLFLKLSQGRAKPTRNLKAYLFAAARNEALQILRARKRDGRADATSEVRDASTPPIFPLERGGAIEAVDWQMMLRGLPVDQREVIAMKVYEEMTFDEIAKIVGASINTVASRYRYGIARLRAALQNEGGE